MISKHCAVCGAVIHSPELFDPVCIDCTVWAIYMGVVYHV